MEPVLGQKKFGELLPPSRTRVPFADTSAPVPFKRIGTVPLSDFSASEKNRRPLAVLRTVCSVTGGLSVRVSRPSSELAHTSWIYYFFSAYLLRFTFQAC